MINTLREWGGEGSLLLYCAFRPYPARLYVSRYRPCALFYVPGVLHVMSVHSIFQNNEHDHDVFRILCPTPRFPAAESGLCRQSDGE